MTIRAAFRDERGVALPMAMMVLVLLTTLMVAFAALSETEPIIAHNQQRVAQARAHAEAGLERAVWALSRGEGALTPEGTPGPTGSLKSPLPVPTPAPYDGTAFIANGTTGGYLVSVTNHPDPNLPNHRVITSTGWTPTNAAGDARTKSHRRIQATVFRLPDLNGGGALTGGGQITISGTANIKNDVSCGSRPRKSVIAADSIAKSGNTLIDANGNGITETTDYVENAGADALKDVKLDSSSLKLLREAAKKNGTYFGPGYPNGTAASSPEWPGTVDFDSSNKLKNGIVFIDTKSGKDIPEDVAAQDLADFASVNISGNPFVSGAFTGWLVVNGSLNISGNMSISGLVYTVDNFFYSGTGAGQILGMVVAQDIHPVNGESAMTFGNAKVTKDTCLKPLYQGFVLDAGSYREVPD